MNNIKMKGGEGISYHDYISKLRDKSPKPPTVNDKIIKKTTQTIPRVKSAPELSSRINYFDYIQQMKTSKSDSNLADK